MRETSIAASLIREEIAANGPEDTLRGVTLIVGRSATALALQDVTRSAARYTTRQEAPLQFSRTWQGAACGLFLHAGLFDTPGEDATAARYIIDTHRNLRTSPYVEEVDVLNRREQQYRIGQLLAEQSHLSAQLHPFERELVYANVFSRATDDVEERVALDRGFGLARHTISNTPDFFPPLSLEDFRFNLSLVPLYADLAKAAEKAQRGDDTPRAED